MSNRCRVVIKSQLMTLHHQSTDLGTDHLKTNKQLIIAMIIPVSIIFDMNHMIQMVPNYFIHSNLVNLICAAISMHVKATENQLSRHSFELYNKTLIYCQLAKITQFRLAIDIASYILFAQTTQVKDSNSLKLFNCLSIISFSSSIINKTKHSTKLNRTRQNNNAL